MSRTLQRRRALARAALAGLCSAFLLLQPVFVLSAQAGPKGIKVVRGKVKVKQRGNKTVIKASNRAIIRYRNLDIAKGERVRFVQPGKNARVLNRVKGPGATRIEGALTANGRVYIVNKSGVHFGPGASVKVAGLAAVGGDISNRDFVRGVDHFVGIEGAVDNHGLIEAGEVHLIGRYVENHGVVLADEGLITMVAGEDVYIGRHDDRILVKIDSSEMADSERAGVLQAGTADAGDGAVVLAAGDMYSLAVNVPGYVGGGDVLVAGHGSGTVEVSGQLDATSENGRGGRIRVLGEDVDLLGAELDASGALGGGEILVGGGLQGEGPEPNADTTLVDEDTSLVADATREGDGGRIVVWADDTAEIHGDISATGAGGGDGGFVETSGKDMLILTTSPELGEGGEWLIDPRNLRIIADAAVLGDDTAGVDDNDTPANPVPPTSTTGEFRASSDDATLEVGLILQALTDGADVTVFTGGGGGQDGDLSVETPIDYDGTGDNTLRLLARNDLTIEVGATISDGDGGTADSLNLQLAADIGADNTTATGDGNGDVIILDDIETNGGFFQSSGQAFDLGDALNVANITTGGGNVDLDHQGAVNLANGTISTGGGDLTSAGTGFDLGTIATASNIATAGGFVNLDHTGAVTFTDGSITTAGGAFTSAGTSFDLNAAGGGVDVDQGSITLTHSGAVNLTAGTLDAGVVGPDGGGDISITTSGAGDIVVGAGTLVTSGTSGVVLDADGTLDLSGAGDLAAANGLHLDGNAGLTLAGDGVAQTLDAGTGELRTENDLVKDGGAALDPTDSLTLDAGGGVVLDATGVANQSITGTNSTVTIDGDVTKENEGTLRLASGGADGITISGNVTGTDQAGSNGVVFETDVTLNGAQANGQADQTLDGGAGNLRFAGDLTKSGGDVTLTAGAAGAGEVRFNAAADQAADAGAGTLTLAADVLKTGAGNLDLTAATIEVGGDVTGHDAGGGLDFDGDVLFTLDDAGQSQVVDGNGGVVTFTGDVQKNVAGNFTLRGTQISMLGAADQTLAANDGIARIGLGGSPVAIVKSGGTGALVLDGAELRLSDDATADTLRLDAGDLRLVGLADQTLESTVTALEIGGSLTSATAGTKTLVGAGAGIVFDGTGDQTASAAGTLELRNAVSKTTAGGLTLGRSGGTVEVDSTVTGNDGGVSFAADEVELTQAVGEQLLSGGTGQLEFLGNVRNTAGGDIGLEGVDAVDGFDVLFSGDGAQLVQTTGNVRVGTPGTPADVKKTGANGLSFDSGTLELSGDATGDGGLTLMAATTTATGTGDQTFSGGAATLDIQGDITKATGGLSLAGATGITFSAAAAQTLTVSQAGQTLALSDSASKTDDGLLTLSATTIDVGGDLGGDGAGNGLDFDGDVVLSQAGAEQEIDGGSGALDFAGDVSKTVGGGYALLGSQVSMTGAGAQTVSASQDAARIGAAGDAVSIVKQAASGTLELAGNEVQLSGDATADALTFSASTVSAIGNGGQTFSANTGALTVAGDVLGTGGGDLRLAANTGLTLNGGAAQTLDAGTGRLLSDLDIVKADAFDLTLGGDGGVVLDRALAVEQQVSAGTGTLRLTDALSRTGGGGVALTGSVVALESGVSGTNGVRFASDVRLEGANAHVLDGGAGALRFEGDVLESANTGDLDLRGATLELAKGAGLTQRLDAGGGALTTGFDLVRAGALTLAADGGVQLTRADASDQRVDSGVGQLTIESNIVKSGQGRMLITGNGIALAGDATGSSAVGSGGLAIGPVDLTGGGAQTLDGGDGVLDLLGDLTNSGGGAIRFDGSAVQANAAVAQSLDAGTGSLALGAELQRSVAGTLDLGGDGGVTAEQGVNLTAGSLGTSDAFTASGDVTAADGIDFGAGVVLDGAGAQTLDAGTGTLLAQSDVTRTGGTSLVLTGGSGVEVQGDLDVQSGAFDTPDAFVAGGDVSVTGDATFQDVASFAGDVSAEGLAFQGQASFDGAGDQLADAGSGALTIDGGLDKTTTGGLTLDGGTVSANTQVDVVDGSLSVRPDIDVRADLNASDGISLEGATDILADGVRIDAGAGSLAAQGVASADASVAGFTLAGASGVDLGGDLTSATGTITVEDDLGLSGAGLQTLSASGAGLSVLGSVQKTAAGSIAIGGTAADITGGVSAVDGTLDTLTATTIGGDVTVTGVLDFDAATTIGGAVSATGLDAEATVRLTGLGDVVLDVGNGDIDITNGDLRAANASGLSIEAGSISVTRVVDGGLVRSAGDLTVEGTLAARTVSADGNMLFQDRVDVGEGGVTALGNVRLRDGIDLGGNLTSQTGTVRVRDGGIELDGQGAQSIRAEDELIVRGDIDKTTGGTLTLQATNGLDLDERVVANGDLVLDGFDGATGTPTSATVYSRSGDLLLRSRNKDVRIQGDERIVAAEGSLTIEADNGSVEVGDLAARENVVVESSDISIRSRSGGPVETSTGGTANDSGPDIIALNVTFSSEPSGAGNLNVATPENGSVSATLSGATIRTLDVPLDDSLFFGNGDLVLDPRATGSVRTNLGGIIAAESASLFTEQTLLLQSLNEVAVSAKPLWASEVVAFLECGLFDADDPDLPPECEGFVMEETGESDDERYQSASAQAALETYRFIFSQVDDIRDVFEDAAGDYQAATGDQAIEGPAFREFLEEDPDSHRAALDYMEKLASLFNQMESMGLEGEDFVEARTLLLDEVAPTDMDALEFDDALRSGGGAAPPGEASNPLFAGSPVPGSDWWWQGEAPRSGETPGS
ncbi:MAG: filamentous hemagglutinin N-terminal domain-containing protein [Myxococcota bacterium]